jgi:hypothetical protein
MVSSKKSDNAATSLLEISNDNLCFLLDIKTDFNNVADNLNGYELMILKQF